LALRKDRRGMAMLVDAMIFLVALTILGAVMGAAHTNGGADDCMETLRSYHSVMLSAELPGEDNSSMSAATLGDYLIALSLREALDDGQFLLIEKMVNGTLAELMDLEGRAWLVIELGSTELRFGSEPVDAGDVCADHRELGDGTVSSTLFVA